MDNTKEEIEAMEEEQAERSKSDLTRLFGVNGDGSGGDVNGE